MDINSLNALTEYKKRLVERLKKARRFEGHDPEFCLGEFCDESVCGLIARRDFNAGLDKAIEIMNNTK